MAQKIRLGFIGANVKSTWASQSHFPALLAHPDIELTAVCTRNAESAAIEPREPCRVRHRPRQVAGCSTARIGEAQSCHRTTWTSRGSRTRS